MVYWLAGMGFIGLARAQNFDEAELNEVYSPMESGCGTAIEYPYLENDKELLIQKSRIFGYIHFVLDWMY